MHAQPGARLGKPFFTCGWKGSNWLSALQHQLQVKLAKPQEVSLNLGVLSDDTDFREWSDEV